jgi:hypothetical protein
MASGLSFEPYTVGIGGDIVEILSYPRFWTYPIVGFMD